MKIKKIFILFLVLILLLSSYVFSNSESLNIISKSCILIDNKTNKILYEKNSKEKMYPASTTKLITAILTLENCELNETITATYDAIMSIPDGYSSANIQIGETLTVEQLLQLLLVHSANDAANILAIYIGGSVDSFVSMMNTKANELNLFDTNFTNTYGKHDENHYSTAYDLSIIMKYCLKNEDFKKISGSASCAITTTNKSNPRLYSSTNELIIPNSKLYYPYITSGKTGYTSNAGDCLVSSAYKNDLELICVILGGKTVNDISTRFSETTKLYEYGFNNFSLKAILKKDDIITQIEIKNAKQDSKQLDLLANNDIFALVNNSVNLNITPEITLKKNISAPIEQNEILGSAKYNIDGLEYETDLIASKYIQESKLLIITLQISIICFFIFLFIFYIYKKARK